MNKKEDNDKMRIGLWGGSGCGKTTFLASIQIATLRNKDPGWQIIGHDKEFPGSTSFLMKSTDNLSAGKFPNTGTTVIEKYGYVISGKEKKHFFKEEISFFLQLQDYPGKFVHEKEEISDPFWDYLVDCQGIIYLYDPLETVELNIRNLQFLSYVWQKSINLEERITNERLKKYIAICIAKYDDPEVVNKLNQAKLLTLSDNSLYPKVIDAKKALSFIAGRFLVNQVEQYFYKDHIKYFASSAVGFSKDSNGNFISNVNMQGDKKIIKKIMPINIIEPVIWIASKVQNEL